MFHVLVNCSECNANYVVEDPNGGEDLNHCEYCGSLLNEGDRRYVPDN